MTDIPIGHIEQLIDHGAQLQRDVDALRAELLAVALLVVALAATLTVLEVRKQWHG